MDPLRSDPILHIIHTIKLLTDFQLFGDFYFFTYTEIHTDCEVLLKHTRKIKLNKLVAHNFPISNGM